MKFGLRMATELPSAIVTDKALSYFAWLKRRPSVGVIDSFVGFGIDFLHRLICILVQPVNSLVHCAANTSVAMLCCLVGVVIAHSSLIS